MESMGKHEQQLTLKCKRGKVILAFSTTPKHVKAKLGSYDWNILLKERSPEILTSIADMIKVIVVTEKQQSAYFKSTECSDLFDGKWPCDDNFDRILRMVTERKRYPISPPEPPGIERKTLDAQGQTKKGGSHSQDRHK
jgi:hypothetical protein